MLRTLGSQRSKALNNCMLEWGPWVSLVAQLIKNLPAMQETRVQSLGWEDSLEKETPSAITPTGYSPRGRKESDMTKATWHSCFVY